MDHGISNPKAAPEDGGSAFPSHGTMGEVVQEGMTLRDWFAGNAMNRMQQEFKEERYPVLAEKAYALADAMLKARKKS
jgi:hypothetical protein